MNSKKGIKYYALIFGFSVLALVLYVSYLAIQEGSFDYDLIYSMILVPPMFTMFLFAFDKVFEKFFPSKIKKNDQDYDKYIKQVGDSIKVQCNFSIEGYRRLRGNASFQKSIEQVYRILTKGETEEMSFEFLEKKFKKDTDEYKALKVVIEEVKKMMEKS